MGYHPRDMLRAVTLLLVGWATLAAATAPDQLESFDTTWTTPSKDSRGSMPIGNGDVALNVWTEAGGDVVFYIGKCDAWSEDVDSPYGLIKVGRVRLALDPPLPTGPGFQQRLRLRQGAIDITGGPADDRVQVRLWVDAQTNVVRTTIEATKPHALRVTNDPWRTAPTSFLKADTILPHEPGRIAWCYRVGDSPFPALAGRTSGAAITGSGLTAVDDLHLQASPATRHAVAVTVLADQTPTLEAWTARLTRDVAADATRDQATAWAAHTAWWASFWDRSWIFVTGDGKAKGVTEGYLLQRFKHACTSRGALPIKFNGSLFTVDYPGARKRKNRDGTVLELPITADYRDWGGRYWFQNTRHSYWPMLASGDFDLMQPLFRMYAGMIPANTAQTRELEKHGGYHVFESTRFWGGLESAGPKDGGTFGRHYFTQGLELSAMLFDYVDYSGDRSALTTYVLPVADGAVTFFDEHFPHEPDGRLSIFPSNALETYWKVKDPLPDIAGLHVVLRHLNALPEGIGTPEQRARWKRLQGQLPPVPVGERDGVRVLLPFADGQKAGGHNQENPELYALWPFHLYGVGLPDEDVAKASFARRRNKGAACWFPDGIWSARVGDAVTAKAAMSKYLTNKSPALRFPAFWNAGFDYAPDEDNGGNGMNGLQAMLVQDAGRKILLLPAWPAGWDAEFRLHAAAATTIQGRVQGGKLVELQVEPAARRADVVVMGGGTLP